MSNVPKAGMSRQASLEEARAALRERPDSPFLKQLVKELEDSMKTPNLDLPDGSNDLMAMRPMD